MLKSKLYLTFSILTLLMILAIIVLECVMIDMYDVNLIPK